MQKRYSTTPKHAFLTSCLSGQDCDKGRWALISLGAQTLEPHCLGSTFWLGTCCVT